uniref:Putative secreted protein n=1 Tax=Amblyomma cajennense TaxID=34607 RepID=A0A023FC45_AMBCJ
MFTAADLCVFLGFLYAFGGAHGNAVTYDTDATKILNPPEQYWLFRQNNNSDTSFTSRNHCVLIEYIADKDTSGMVVLSTSNHVKHEQWESAMYTVSVYSSVSNTGDVLRFTPLDAEDRAGTYSYRVLHVNQSLCYIVEMVSASGEGQENAGGTHTNDWNDLPSEEATIINPVPFKTAIEDICVYINSFVFPPLM